MDTPQCVSYSGKRCASDKICGVSILRAGETMEQAVCDVCKDIRIGKILIQTNKSTGEPEVCSQLALILHLFRIMNIRTSKFSFTICVYLKTLKTIWLF